MTQNPTATFSEGGSELSETVYAHLRAIAQRKISEEKPGHTLQATALVHEAFMRLDKAGQRPAELGTRFYWAAAEAMRRILIEHARAKKAAKRGGGAQRVDWYEVVGGVADLAALEDPEQIEGLDAAISRLQVHDPRSGEVVRLRFFAGLTVEEVASALGITPRATKRDWEYARAWLMADLKGRRDDQPTL